VSHKSGHIITFTTPISEGSRIKVWHCVAGLAAVAGIVGAVLF
jgi:hypothetical protein